MELKTEQTQWKWWNGKIIQFTDPFFKKALLISWIYILIEFKLCSNATRSTNTGWVLQHTFHSRTLYIPFSFISLCFVYSFTLIQFARTCESVQKRQQTTLAIRDALIAIALLSFHANFPNMFAMRIGGGRGGTRKTKKEEGEWADICNSFVVPFHVPRSSWKVLIEIMWPKHVQHDQNLEYNW